MADSSEILESTQEEDPGPRPKAEPIESRFLFVDVAALRAKQLRRGARPRLADDDTPVDLFGGQLVASNGRIHAQMRAVIDAHRR